MRPKNTEKESLKMLIPLIKYGKSHLVKMIFVLILSVVSSILTILGPGYISDITNILSAGLADGNIDTAAIIAIGIRLIVMYCLAYICSFLQAVLMAYITQYMSYSLRKDIVAKINRLPLRFFDNNLVGDTLSLITNDIDTIGFTMQTSLGNLFLFSVQFVAVLIVMFITNWVLTLVSIAAALLGFLVMVFVMSHSQKYFIRQQVELGNINGHAEEIYASHSVVRVYNAETKEKEKFDKINNRLYNAAWRAQFFSGVMQPVMGFVGNLGYVAVCIVGALMTMKGIIPFGTIVAFMIYIRLFTNPLQQFGQIFTQLQSTAAASKRVFNFLGEEEMEDDNDYPILVPFGGAKGEIAFNHVNFGYYEGQTIIKDFSAEAKAGQKVAIVGPTGAGKTTMVNLLMKFYEVNSGSITIDGYNIKDMKREEVHALFGMVLQDTWLFEGTMRDNIKYSKEATDEQVIEAAKMCGIHHFIMTLPDGYDTVLSEETNVSQGQKQLITIARAMVENAPFLILDEATSSVDTRTEQLIQDAMDKLMKGRTSFIIAHRLSTIKNADLILVMKDGDIIEQGNHEELMAKGGFYADLYNSQFDKVE